LETIIRETWHYDDFSTSKTAVKLARVFLSSCLTNYTFSRVSVVDGNVAGIGTHEELLENCEVYQEIYYSQFRKEKEA
jgi:hypothetical protein